MMNRARSLAVVHNPAAACSGYTCQVAFIARPCPSCARDNCAATSGGGGCSNELLVIFSGARTVASMNAANGCFVISVSASCITVTPPPEYL